MSASSLGERELFLFGATPTGGALDFLAGFLLPLGLFALLFNGAFQFLELLLQQVAVFAVGDAQRLRKRRQ